MTGSDRRHQGRVTRKSSDTKKTGGGDECISKELYSKLHRSHRLLECLFHAGSSLHFQDQIKNEWSDIDAVFKAVMRLVLVAKDKAYQPLKERRQDVEKEANALMDGLHAEISRLEKTISELVDITALEDHIFFLQVGGSFAGPEPCY